MLKKRLIPVLLLRDGQLVKTTRFGDYQVIGLPTYQVERYNQWAIDELVFLDISSGKKYDGKRDDLRIKNLTSVKEIVTAISSTCFMPLTFGGQLRNMEDIHGILESGADRVTLNTQAFHEPELVRRSSDAFGAQCIVVVIDFVSTPEGPRVCIDRGKTTTDRAPADWAREMEENGAGEIILQSIDRDGTYKGYDTETLKDVCDAVNIPVISLGGARTAKHFIEGINAGASGAAAANIFHILENADRQIRRQMNRAGIPLRSIDGTIETLEQS